MLQPFVTQRSTATDDTDSDNERASPPQSSEEEEGGKISRKRGNHVLKTVQCSCGQNFKSDANLRAHKLHCRGRNRFAEYAKAVHNHAGAAASESSPLMLWHGLESLRPVDSNSTSLLSSSNGAGAGAAPPSEHFALGQCRCTNSCMQKCCAISSCYFFKKLYLFLCVWNCNAHSPCWNLPPTWS